MSVAHLALDGFTGMRSDTAYPASAVQGRRVTAVAGIGDPRSFAAQLSALGATVSCWPIPTITRTLLEDIERLARVSGAADYLVVTEKDAVKLRGRWPREAPEPLVAALAVQWERNGRPLEEKLDAVLRLPRVSDP